MSKTMHPASGSDETAARYVLSEALHNQRVRSSAEKCDGG
jgi:hypothetical protein